MHVVCPAPQKTQKRHHTVYTRQEISLFVSFRDNAWQRQISAVCKALARGLYLLRKSLPLLLLRQLLCPLRFARPSCVAHPVSVSVYLQHSLLFHKGR